jgi:hypothetical protein
MNVLSPNQRTCADRDFCTRVVKWAGAATAIAVDDASNLDT